MYRTILLLINIAALIFLTYLTIEEYPHRSDEIALMIGLYIYVITNTIYVFSHKEQNDKQESLISLYFKRKSLEEKKKIENLQQ